MFGCILRLLALLAIRSTAVCLHDAIPAEDRALIKNADGVETEIVLIPYSWDSSYFVTKIAEILISEALGYSTRFYSWWPTEVLDSALLLSLCSTAECNETRPGTVGHIALESWIGAYGVHFETFRDRHPSMAPEDLGTMGYSGEEALYASRTILQEAWDESGYALEYFRTYNTSHYDAQKYFDRYTDLPADEIVLCNDTGSMFTDTAYMNPYAQWTGDMEGLIEVPGGYHAYCQGDGRFWFSPACRQNTTACIPILSPYWGWMVDAYMAWATAYGIPAAIGISWDHDIHLNHYMNFRILTYAFRPNGGLANNQPDPIRFPPHSESEWAQGNKRTDSVGSYIGKLVSRSLRSQAFKVHEMMRHMRLDMQELQHTLEEAQRTRAENAYGYQNYGYGATDVLLNSYACQWAQANRHRWNQWIPKETTCFPGFGLVDASGMYVSSRDSAASCSVCTPGTFSEQLVDESGQTYRCESCPLGRHQQLSSETICLQCEQGRVASLPGQSACEACPLGKYANSSGMTECFSCGTGPAWTTSRLSEDYGPARWVEVESAVSRDYCHCLSGWFLDSETCQECMQGAECPGSNAIMLLPGYFSSSRARGSVFKCFSDPSQCPGGLPGACSSGRDNSSVACSACLPGLRQNGPGCGPCGREDYFILIFFLLLIGTGTGLLHRFYLRAAYYRNLRHGDHLLNASMFGTQLVVCLQLVAIVQKIAIDWEEPFASVLDALNFVSLAELMESLHAISCVARIGPTANFLLQTLGAPCSFMVVPCLMHLFRAAVRSKAASSQKGCVDRYVLCETLGSIFVLFFIAQCNAIAEPFQCQSHPNGMWSMRASIGVFCNFYDTHLELCIAGVVLSTVPLCFLSACAWAVLVEFPRRLRMVDMTFIRACSFLILRFRPGCEAFSIFLLIRNVLLALAPVLPSANASLLLISALLGLNFYLVSSFKPWRSDYACHADLVANTAFLAIIFQAAFFVTEVNRAAVLLLCTVALILVILGLTAWTLVAAGSQLATRKMKRKFDFFISHQKNACGSLARLLKIELQLRGQKVFLDADDLTDLSRLFAIVASNVSQLLFLCSPQVLTSRWCVAELVTARMQGLETTLLMLPKFFLPSDEFIRAYENTVIDIQDLASYGFAVEDITETLRWLGSLRAMTVSQDLFEGSISYIADQLANAQMPSRSAAEEVGSGCLILADHGDIEAVATAHVLLHMISPHVLHVCNVLPRVLASGERLRQGMAVLAQGQFLILLCTKNSLTASCIIEWLLQAHSASSSCHILPILAEEGYQIPQSSEAFDDLCAHPNVQNHNAAAYNSILKAIFMHIAVHFMPKFSGEAALALKAKEIASRMRHNDMPSLGALKDMSAFPNLQLDDIHLASSGKPCDVQLEGATTCIEEYEKSCQEEMTATAF
ncbi:unnamed protein product [Symbiodinium sp. CCMP2456]|nr:unnamed protein product [Symbiodinium sp. CCMP2456]